MRSLQRIFIIYLIMTIAVLGLQACGTPKFRNGDVSGGNKTATAVGKRNVGGVAYDPFEKFNRAIFRFNQRIDKYLLKPLARFYRKVIPKFIRTGVSNFFNNLREPINFINNALQGKFKRVLITLGRFIINTIFGLFGIFDVANLFGLKRYKEDFGQTLAVWGGGVKRNKRSKYLMLPFFGPSTLRDGVGTIVDLQLYPLTHMKEKSTRDKIILFEAIITREAFLTASEILDEATTDPYIFIREAYYQRRHNAIFDGNPPERKQKVDDDFLFGDDDSKKPEKDKKSKSDKNLEKSGKQEKTDSRSGTKASDTVTE